MFHCIPRAGNIASVFYYSAVIARAEQNLMTQLMQLILKKICCIKTLLYGTFHVV